MVSALPITEEIFASAKNKWIEIICHSHWVPKPERNTEGFKL